MLVAHDRERTGWYHSTVGCQNARMKGRTGFVIGLGVGYVLGTKAGRARYEQIKSTVEKATEQPQIHEAIERTSEITAGPRAKSKALLSDQLRTASELIRQRTDAAASKNGR